MVTIVDSSLTVFTTCVLGYHIHIYYYLCDEILLWNSLLWPCLGFICIYTTKYYVHKYVLKSSKYEL